MANASPNTIGLRPFPKGHKLGKGDPLAGKREKLRAALIKAISAVDIEKIAKALVIQAISGDVQAAKEVLDRAVGKATQPIEHSGSVGVRGEIESMANALDDPETRQLAVQLAERMAGISGNTGLSSN